MPDFSPNTNWDDARKLRAFLLAVDGLLLLTSFALFTEAALQKKAFYEWDLYGKEQLHEYALANAAARTFFLRFTDLASQQVLLAGAALVLVVLAVKRAWRLGLIWSCTTLGGFKLVSLVKVYYDRARPSFVDPIIVELSPSMPSGHTADATLLVGMLAYLLIRFTRRSGWIALPFLAVFIIGIAFSRVYLGAHYVSDVIAGMFFGAGVAALGMAAAEATRER
jgi:membrane-associated phospholipid phosphatase